jgi:hypothetical protein
MQTLAFLWFELKAAKRHVKESLGEAEQCGKTDFSLLNRPPDSDAIDESPQRRRHLSLRWTEKREARVGRGPCLQGH